MGLFFEILSSINNPNKQGNIEQLSQTINNLQQLSIRYGIDSLMMQKVLSSFGSGLRPLFNQQLEGKNLKQMDNVWELSTNYFQLNQVNSLLSPALQEQIVQKITQATHLNSTTLQNMFPTLISATLNLLNMGKSNTVTSENNSILNTFLKSETDENADLGNVFKFANRFLNPPPEKTLAG